MLGNFYRLPIFFAQNNEIELQQINFQKLFNVLFLNGILAQRILEEHRLRGIHDFRLNQFLLNGCFTNVDCSTRIIEEGSTYHF